MTQAILLFGDNRLHRGKLLSASAIVTDPPYGIAYAVNERRFPSRCAYLKGSTNTTTSAQPGIVGDDQLFDPAPWLNSARVAFCGANHFADKLPLGRWLVWDKRRESKPDAHSDAELIWLSGDHTEALRVHRQKWRGIIREGEENCSRSKKLHPNQKPVALLDVIFDKLGLKPEDTVADPYMGSGSTAVAALRRGMNFVGCEIDACHFETAYQRLRAEFGAGRVAVA